MLSNPLSIHMVSSEMTSQGEIEAMTGNAISITPNAKDAYKNLSQVSIIPRPLFFTGRALRARSLVNLFTILIMYHGAAQTG